MSSILLKSGPSLAASFEAYPVIQNIISSLYSCAAEYMSLLAKIKTSLCQEKASCASSGRILSVKFQHGICSILSSRICSRKFLDVLLGACMTIKPPAS